MSFFLLPSGWIIQPLFFTEFSCWAILISAAFLHWISSLSYPHSITLYILNKHLIKQLFPDPRLRRLSFEYPGSAGAGPRQLPMFVPAYETRLGPFLHQEETKNIFQEHKRAVFSQSAFFPAYLQGVVSVLLSGHPWWIHLLTFTLCQGDTFHWGGSVAWRVSEWPRGWAQCPPQAPMACNLMTSLERTSIAILAFYVSGCPSNYSASSKKEHVHLW